MLKVTRWRTTTEIISDILRKQNSSVDFISHSELNAMRYYLHTTEMQGFAPETWRLFTTYTTLHSIALCWMLDSDWLTNVLRQWLATGPPAIISGPRPQPDYFESGWFWNKFVMTATVTHAQSMSGARSGAVWFWLERGADFIKIWASCFHHHHKYNSCQRPVI